MARACSICTHERREEIDAAIAAGDAHRAIGRNFGVGNDAVARHAASHLAGPAKEQPEASATAVAVPVVVGKPAEPDRNQSRARGVPTSKAPASGSNATDSATPASGSATAMATTATPAQAIVEVADEDIPRCPPTRAERVEAIERMMLALAWAKGKTGPRVAKAWGLTLAAVESYSAEAARNIRRSLDPQAMKARLAKALEDGLVQAFATGEVRAVSALVKTYADMLGLVQSGKVEINILQAPMVQEFSGALVALLAALCPEHGETVDAWLADVDTDRDGARSDPVGWLERRRGTITVEVDG